ncbi:3-isopropylmalate dehydratase [Hwanghaeella grinnelliae]|uniref:3-isopropylmalate dehydratase small subunit n=1 Tax=Hwanghaeella grinnelliae TaxID=2500179 RepID=A0A3S2W6Z7_9PROT|nr:3-isopropylmalate dehydratase [Hwanghaeella grinnelliae]RVU34025.1 3-isopropylmalate dehydratase [Hwanghaeella grinnelliae]
MTGTAENTGRAWVYGDNVDTDLLAPGAYMKGPVETMATHCLEAIDPDFATSATAGDIVVGGKNFGMGSSREQAAQVLGILGIRAVVAKSFGGIFYRNAFNLGLLALVCPDVDKIASGDALSIDPAAGKIENLTQGTVIATEPVPDHLLNIVGAGGLVPYLEKKIKGAA